MERELIVHLGDFGEHSVLEFDADVLIETCTQSIDEELRALAEVLRLMFEKDKVIEANIFDATSSNGKRIRIQKIQYILEELIANKGLFSFYCIRCNKRHDGKEIIVNKYKFDQGKEYSCPRSHYLWNVTHNA